MPCFPPSPVGEGAGLWPGITPGGCGFGPGCGGRRQRSRSIPVRTPNRASCRALPSPAGLCRAAVGGYRGGRLSAAPFLARGGEGRSYAVLRGWVTPELVVAPCCYSAVLVCLNHKTLVSVLPG